MFIKKKKKESTGTTGILAEILKRTDVSYGNRDIQLRRNTKVLQCLGEAEITVIKI